MTARWLPGCSVDVKMAWPTWAHTVRDWMDRPFNLVRVIHDTSGTGGTGHVVNTLENSNPHRRQFEDAKWLLKPPCDTCDSHVLRDVFRSEAQMLVFDARARILE